MNRSIFWRVFWKEYRLQRALWIAMAVLTTLLLWLIFEFTSPKDRPLFLFSLAVAFPALYALGCGATLFAGEREAETYEFQRALPVSARQVFVGKIVLALLSTATLFGLMWLLAAFLSGWKLPDTHNQGMAWATFGFFGLEMFLWATLFSLLSKRVLMVAILGVAAASVSTFIMARLIIPQMVMETYMTALPRRAVVAALVALTDFWLAARWFNERRERRLRSARPAIGADMPMQATSFSNRFRASGRTAILGRLLWQHWRQSLGMIIVVLGTIFIPLTVIFATWLNWPKNWFFRGYDDPIILYLGIMPALLTAPLLGLCTFLPDQWRSGFRFLADRGVPPKYIWLSRQTTSLVPVALMLPVFLAFAVLLAPGEYSSRLQGFVWHTTAACACVFGYVVVGVTAGQLCAMFLRSGILAGIFTVLLTALLAGWCGLMLFWHVNWLWSVLPIPLALLLATRLRTANWLLERNTLRAWLVPALALVVPTVALLTAVPLYRIYQIPVASGFSLEKYDRPMTSEERATLDLYRQAIVKYINRKEALFKKGTPEHAKTNDADLKREAIALMIKASKQELSHLIEGQSPLGKVADLLLIDAKKVEQEGKLDAALERYLAAIRVIKQLRQSHLCRSAWNCADSQEMHTYACLSSWASRPNQTPERIIAAERQLEKLTSHIFPGGPIELQYFFLRRVLNGDLTALSALDRYTNRPLPMLTMLWLHLPWERARALRLLNFQTYCELGGTWGDDDHYRRMSRYTQICLAPLRKSELLYALRAQLHLPPISRDRDDGDIRRDRLTLAESYRAIETARHAVRVVLALEAWKLQHGSLPKSLDELVGPCLDRLPNDPYSREPFRYFREGLKIPLHWSQPLWGWPKLDARGDISANKPFIWSTGAKVRVSRPGSTKENILDEYQIELPWSYEYFIHRATRKPTSEYDIWSSGWPFPIP